jgi:hypothetical protein
MLNSTGLLICPQCGTKTAPDQMVCGKCGKPLSSCTVCGTKNLAGQKFCHNCGKRLPVPEPSETTIDERVLRYLAASKGGEISITRASQDLNIDRERLVESLTRLRNGGKIEIDRPTSKADN